uniref:CSON009870 protein n=1 Tax=Culicoides sonorensis TaxID=179676 RepID=A0A336MYV3_CULSO
MSRKTSKQEVLIKDIVIVGDAYVGKTNLLNRFRDNYFEDEYKVTIYDRADFELNVDNCSHVIRLHDTNCHKRLYLSRRSIYENASCLIVCYAVDNHASYQSVVYNWTREFMVVRQFVPIVLVATKVDLRKPGSTGCVTTEEGEILSKQINANSFIECSAKEDIRVRETIYEAVRAAVVGVPEQTKQDDANDGFCCGLSWNCCNIS